MTYDVNENTLAHLISNRSGKTKITKNSNEAEYRAIFDNLIEDLLAVLYWPEWPAAGLLLSIASKFMVLVHRALRKGWLLTFS